MVNWLVLVEHHCALSNFKTALLNVGFYLKYVLIKTTSKGGGGFQSLSRLFPVAVETEGIVTPFCLSHNGTKTLFEPLANASECLLEAMA